MIIPEITYHPNGNKLSEAYYLNNNLHNDQGIAYSTYNQNGNKISEGYYLNGRLHNASGPAQIIYDENGNKYSGNYYLNGEWLRGVHSLEELKRYIKLNNIS